MKRLLIACSLFALLTGFGMPPALAIQDGPPTTWREDDDAFGLPQGAQAVRGSGNLFVIAGRVEAARPGETGRRDMFKICVTGGRTFSATTLGTGTTFDTQLFLFDSAGRGVYANDDTGNPPTVQSDLPPGTAEQDDTGSSPEAPGVYYLAISGFDSDPRDSNGNLIFPSSPFTRVHAPNDPSAVIAGWSGSGGSGPYNIVLTGARFLNSAGQCDVEALRSPAPSDKGASS
jgi:hypothetical protein